MHSEGLPESVGDAIDRLCTSQAFCCRCTIGERGVVPEGFYNIIVLLVDTEDPAIVVQGPVFEHAVNGWRNPGTQASFEWELAAVIIVVWSSRPILC